MSSVAGPDWALRLEGVVKRYRGGRLALDHLSFEVEHGVVCGLVGPNGAGKTTTFSLVSGFLEPDEGHVHVLGEGAFDPMALKGRLGVLPQDAELPDLHTPFEVLEHLARLSGLGRAQASREALRVLEVVDLQERKAHRIGTLSHGMRRRVALASAMLGNPELILLDEPTAGLDPRQQVRVREVIAHLRGHSTVMVSSHNLAEIEQVCDRVVLMEQGRCLAQGSVAEVTGVQEVLAWQLPASTDVRALIAALAPHEAHWDGVWLRVRAQPGADPASLTLRVMEVLLAHQVAIVAMRRGVSLEEKFLETAGD